MNGIKLRGTGRCVPANTVTNDDLSRLVDTNDEWITARTGIRSRYRCEKETLTELCVSAARDALHMAGITPADIGVCIVATVSADTVVPSAACLLQRALGLPERFLIDDSAVLAPAAPEDAAQLEVLRGPNIKEFPQGKPVGDAITAKLTLKVGDNITTDHIMPAGSKILPYRSNIPKLSEFCFAVCDKEFAKTPRQPERPF